MPESPLANFGSVGGGAGCGVARRVRGAGRPARANKEKSSVRGWEKRGAGNPPQNQSRSPLMSLILLKIMLQLHRSTPGSGSMTSLTSCSISAWLAATAWTCSLLQPVTR